MNYAHNSSANPFTLFHPVPRSPPSSDSCHSAYFWRVFTYWDSILMLPGDGAVLLQRGLSQGTDLASGFHCSSCPSLSPSQRLLPFDCFSLKSTPSSRVLLGPPSHCLRSFYLRTWACKVSPEIAVLLPSSDLCQQIGGERSKVLSICGDCTDSVNGIWITKWRSYLLKVRQQEHARARTRRQVFIDVFAIKYYLRRKERVTIFWLSLGQRKEWD